MKDLLVSHNDRLENYFFALEKERQQREESNKDFDFKLNALINAQIRNETDVAELKKPTIELRKSTTELRKSTTELKESIKELRISSNDLKEASQSQLQRVEKLENG